MNTPQEYLLFTFNIIRCIPHLIIFYLHKNKSIIKADVERGFELMGKSIEHQFNFKQPFGLIYLLTFCRQFRNLFYYRTRPYSILPRLICPELPTLTIQSKQIGEGLAIVNGFATAIGAESIGKNCIIYQQVTLGGTKYGAPKILDNVTISSGAIIIGKVTIGNNVVIGANATVFRDVPDNCTVLPASSLIMKWRINNTHIV